MKNILILTIDCWNLNIGTNTSYTYSNLFSTMEDYTISNIYIREELPNDSCCKRYFQISENKVLKSLFKRNIQTGREVTCNGEVTTDDTSSIEMHKRLYSKQRNNFYYTKKMIREMVWLFGHWKSNQLDDFLLAVKPDIVIFSMEGYIHFNRLCRYVLKKTGVKSIGYFWDDNFTYKQRPTHIGYILFRFFQRRSLKKLSRMTNAFWAIAPKTKEEADKFFKIDCRVVPKPAERESSPAFEHYDNRIGPIRMLYAGNLMIGRMETIRAVAESLVEINREDLKITLDVYTPTDVPQELCDIGFGTVFHSPVSQNEILNLEQTADILLFAEDIIGDERKVARLSFSTKIPDYLSSGKCILALGDYDTAPMEYFRTEQIALCASDKQELVEQLLYILNNPNIMKKYAQRAYTCAKKNHSKFEIKCMIRNSIEEVLVK